MVFRRSYGFTVLLLCAATAVSWLISDGSLISGVFYSLVLLFSERLTGLSAYGSRADSRLWFTGVFLALAPVFMVSQVPVLYYCVLLCVICSLYAAVKLAEGCNIRWVLLLLLSGAVAVVFDIRTAALLLPVSVELAWIKIGRKKLPDTVLSLLPVIVFTAIAIQSKYLTELVASWNFASLAGAGHIPAAKGEIPGFIYVIYPVVHPWFCVLLPGLFLLFRKTDLDNPARRILTGGAVFYLFLMGGLPERELFSLLPVYVILLTVAFPSWDRIYCYGLYFFKRTVWLTIAVLILVQISMIAFGKTNQGHF